MSVICTFGYEDHTLDEFLSLVQQYAIDLVLDVREIPLSKDNPDFNKFSLIKSLRKCAINYFYVKPLGSTETIRRCKLDELGTLKYFQAYERHLQQHRHLIHDIAVETKGLNICILCRERDPETCHRTLVADYLQLEQVESSRLKHWI